MIQLVLGCNFCIIGIDLLVEVYNFVLLLCAGVLIVLIFIVEECIIGLLMGQQNIDMGIQVCIWGMVVVMLFMVFYYCKFGMIVNIVLMVNFVLIIGVMLMILGVIMILLGIVGIVLMVGMVVDVNVLIFECICEELCEGKNLQ